MRRIAFRADASQEVGHGHVMRCLALANALRAAGNECLFLCRDLPGHRIEAIEAHGHEAAILSLADEPRWEDDADRSLDALQDWHPDWLVVDHYGLDARWESRLAETTDSIAVIDDLVDRPHACVLLVDQTLGRDPAAYASLTPTDCRVLAGPAFALLRPEFAAMRERSLARRRNPSLHRVLVSVGGVDVLNTAGRVLDALARTPLAAGTYIEIAVTHAAPHLDSLRAQALRMPVRTRVLVDTADMAGLLAEADLAIGAGGISSWERCCLGVPSIVLVLANNQRDVAKALDKAGATLLIDDPDRLTTALQQLASPGALAAMRDAAARVTDGHGVARVIASMEARHG